jgi:hypothetical protein
MEISSTFADPLINILIVFANAIKVEGFEGFVLLFNPSQVTSGVSKGWNIGYLVVPYQISQAGTSFNVNSVASAYGPSYSPKCILGFYKFIFRYQNTFEYILNLSPVGNYTGLTETKAAPNTLSGNLFCFGNSTECG